MESILAATNFVRSLRGIQILSGAIELVKWNLFWRVHGTNDFKNSIQAIKIFVESLDKKDQQSCLKLYEQIKAKQKPSCNSLMHFQKHASRDLKYANIGMVSLTLPPCVINLFQLTRKGTGRVIYMLFKIFFLFFVKQTASAIYDMRLGT